MPNAASPAPLRTARRDLLRPPPPGRLPGRPAWNFRPPGLLRSSLARNHRTDVPMRQGIPLSLERRFHETITRTGVRTRFLASVRPRSLAMRRAQPPRLPRMAEKSARPRARDARPRRRLQVDHRAAPAGRPALLRLDRQGRRALRGGGAPAGAAALRERRHADRRRHRPAPARLRPPGDGRDQRRRQHRSRSPRRSRRSTRSIYVVMTAGSFDVLCEVVSAERRGAARPGLRPHPRRARRPHHRDVHLPQARQADLLVGRPLSCDLDYRSLSLWHDTAGRRLRTASRAARPGVVRRRDRRRRPHRALDGLLPAPGRPVAADRGARGGGGRLRRLGPQRRLVQRAVPDLAGTRWSRASSDGRRPPDAPGDAGDGARGRPGRRGRGDRRALPARRHGHPGPHPRCSWSGCGDEVATAHARGFTEDDERLLERRRGAQRCSAADARARRRRSPRTARRSTPRGSCADWPGWSRRRGADLRADPRARHRSPAGWRPTPARCAPRSCCAPPRATRRGWPACGARWRRCTR